MDTYRAIKYHFRHAPDTVLWMDIFCLDQRVFYPLKLRNSAKARLNGYDEDDAFATVATTAAATAITGSTGPPPNSLLSPESRFFSPAVKRGTGQQPQQHAYGTESPIAMSVYSDGGYEEGPLEPTASAAASAAAAAIGAPAASSYRRSVPSHNSAPTLAGGGRQQWNGMHNMAGGAGDWCADILKHGMDAIGSVLLVINPAPNPEPMSGNIPVDDNSTRATKSDVPGEGPGSPDTVSSPRGRVHWDRSRYMNPINALSRLWCLYEIYCTTVVRDSDAVGGILPSIASPTARSTAAAAAMDTAAHHQRGSNSRPSSSTSRQGSAPSREGTQKRRNKNQCAFDIALHYSILDDDEHNTNSSNVRNKRSPFAVDLEATCRDFEHLTKWICCMDLAQCEASDAADAQRLLHIISVDIGSGIFFETVRNVLEEWVHATLNTVSTERPAAAARGASNSSSTSTNTNTSYNTITNKQRLYVQHCVCKLYHIRGDPVRAEGAMIELGKYASSVFILCLCC